jgi:hypothetical protein
MAISNPTPKQVRNGADTGAPGSGATMNQPGPDVTRQVVSAKRQAESAADRRKDEAAGLIQSPQGTGVSGHQIGANGDMFVWDSGLAVNDVEGGGSG